LTHPDCLKKIQKLRQSETENEVMLQEIHAKLLESKEKLKIEKKVKKK